MVLYQVWQTIKAQHLKRPGLYTFAACFDVTALAGGYWIWKQLRHNEENRLYCYENYPRILGVYYWGLNVLSFGERLGDKQQDYDIGKWVYEDVQDGKTGTLLSDIWEEEKEKPVEKNQKMVTEGHMRLFASLIAGCSFIFIANYLIKLDNRSIETDPIPAASWKSYVEIMKKMGKEP
uniref:Innexin n=2 Tax=Meloidogyne TaxID=189290 RepID=A0A915LK83_MELJA